MGGGGGRGGGGGGGEAVKGTLTPDIRHNKCSSQRDSQYFFFQQADTPAPAEHLLNASVGYSCTACTKKCISLGRLRNRNFVQISLPNVSFTAAKNHVEFAPITFQSFQIKI